MTHRYRPDDEEHPDDEDHSDDEDHPANDPVDDGPSEGEDFVLDLVREPEAPSPVPDDIRAMRARRVPVDMPTGEPSVQEALLNPTGVDVTTQPHPRAVRRLMRAQLRLAVSLMSWFFGLVVAVNVAFHFSPELAAATLVGVPVEWFVPVVVFIPLLIFLGWFYVHRATGNERAPEYDVGQPDYERVRP